MKWLNVVIKYRLWLGFVFLALAIFTNVQAGFWPSFVLYLTAVVLIVGHFVFGPMRLIQECMETGDMEGAKKVLSSIWFPALLIKPIRSVYYTVKGNLDMVDQNFEGAEKNLKSYKGGIYDHQTIPFTNKANADDWTFTKCFENRLLSTARSEDREGGRNRYWIRYSV